MFWSRLKKRPKPVAEDREAAITYDIYRQLNGFVNEEGTRGYLTFTDPTSVEKAHVIPIIAADEAQLAQAILLQQKMRQQMLAHQQGERGLCIKEQSTRTRDTNPTMQKFHESNEWRSLSMKPRHSGTFAPYDKDWWDRPG